LNNNLHAEVNVVEMQRLNKYIKLFDLIWFEFIHSYDIDLNSIHERNYAMYIEWTKLSEKENHSSTI